MEASSNEDEGATLLLPWSLVLEGLLLTSPQLAGPQS